MEIYFGAKVVAADGTNVGEARRVLVDPNTREVTDIVITVPPAERLLPLSLIQDADERRVIIRATQAEVNQCEVFLPASMETKPLEQAAGSSGITSETHGQTEAIVPKTVRIALAKGCPIEAVDGKLGNLAGVKLDLYANKIASVVMQTAAQQTQLDLPADFVAEMDTCLIRLATTKAEATKTVGRGAGPYLSVEGEGEGQAGGDK